MILEAINTVKEGMQVIHLDSGEEQNSLGLEGVEQPRIRKDSLGWLAMKEPMGMGPILRE